MVELETVLVLGAGASRDFAFPTGSELVTRILEITGNTGYSSYNLFHELCYCKDISMAKKFHDVLQKAKPLSIDALLEHNPQFIEVGKIAIAIELLQCEQGGSLKKWINYKKVGGLIKNKPCNSFGFNALRQQHV